MRAAATGTSVLVVGDPQYEACGHGGNSISMGGMHSMPQTTITPQPARIVRRADLVRDETIQGLVAEIRRVFVDASAVDEG